jgi:hypothetical protein
MKQYVVDLLAIKKNYGIEFFKSGKKWAAFSKVTLFIF